MNPTEGNPPRPAPAGREFLFHTLLTLGFFLSITFVPLAGLLAGMLTPVPTAISLIRFGFPAATIVPLAAAIAGTIVMLWLDMAQAIPLLIVLLLVGFLLGYGMREAWGSTKTIGISSLVMIAIAALLLAVAYIKTGGQVISYFEKDLRETVSAALKGLGESAAEPDLENSLLSAVPLIVRIMPGILVSSTLAICWINVLLARRYCRAASLEVCIREDLTLWKAPEMLVWIVIACGAALILPFGELGIPAVNVLIVLGTIYFFQGIAIVSFYQRKWSIPLFLRALIYCIAVLQQFVSVAVALIGLFDTWLDFRRMHRKPA